MIKDFYDKHKNFSSRTLIEYYISPGIKCKFDILKANIETKKKYSYGIDLGSSGNSFLFFMDNISKKFSLDIADLPLKQYIHRTEWHPLCGDIMKLPYRDNSFDFLTALDVIEHIKDDECVISEISRVVKNNGIVVITVPHRMKYYTNQDRLIGHYRRYEFLTIASRFENYNLKVIRTFGVYGKLMRIADIQSSNPKKIEANLLNLRKRYMSDGRFRRIWDFFIKYSSVFMKIDAKYHSLKKAMNIGIIFRKVKQLK
ncbi:MAG: class I SAM-dependent methyltransferase [Candidatus Thorarchaeota archaeon]